LIYFLTIKSAWEGIMGKEPEQWFKQAQYDLSTAEAMFDAKKYIIFFFFWKKSACPCLTPYPKPFLS